MPDLSNMCINIMTSPWSRVRHWSAPERLQWTSGQPDTYPTSKSEDIFGTESRPMSHSSASCWSLNFESSELTKAPPHETESDCDLSVETLVISENNSLCDEGYPTSESKEEEEDSLICKSEMTFEEEMGQNWFKLLNFSASSRETETSNAACVDSTANVNERLKSEMNVREETSKVKVKNEATGLNPNRIRNAISKDDAFVPETDLAASPSSDSSPPEVKSASYSLSDWISPLKISADRVSNHLAGFTSTSVHWHRSRIKALEWKTAFCILISTVFLIMSPVSGRICPSVNIYHLDKMEKPLRGCTVIEGHLAFMVDQPPPANFTSPTFPELREINDFLLLYLSNQIKTLRTFFPNLSVIRGNRLLKDYALIIREVKGMEEIGLISLTHILRGAVRIEKNSDLCYVDTVDWESIVTHKYHHLISIERNEFFNKNCLNKCPDACHSACWNDKSCQTLIVECPHGTPSNLICYRNGTTDNGQIRYQCDKECLGGCYGTTIDSCFACANARILEHGGGCRKQCPKPLLLYENWRCITAKECSNKTFRYNAEVINQVKHYKAFDGKCLESCPPETKEKQIGEGSWICESCENCPLECQGAEITSLEDMYRFLGCTTIKGDLSIQVKGERVVEELQKAFHKVRIITGYLKIARSVPVVSLDFFQSLEQIQGIHPPDSKENKKHYSITIMENENLQKLFPVRPDGKNVKIYRRNGPDGESKKGRAFIHYNPKLCGKEIRALLNHSGLEDPGENSAEISYATNGDKAVCSERKLNLTVSFDDNDAKSPRSERFRMMNMIVQFENYQKVITTEDPTNNYRALLGYEIHYRIIDKATYTARNLTKYGGRDACGDDEWQIIDHPPTDQDRDQETLKPVWPSEVELILVYPYTYYAIFVTTLIVKEVAGSSGIDGAQSDIVYVLSPEDNPTPPQKIRFTNLNYSSVNISWSPPVAPNGIVDHYEVYWELRVPKLEKLRDINYCDPGYRERQKEFRLEKEKPKPPETNTSVSAVCPCDCRTCVKPSKRREMTALEKKLRDETFVDSIIDALFPPTTFSLPGEETRAKRSLSFFVENHGNDIGVIEGHKPYTSEEQSKLLNMTSIAPPAEDTRKIIYVNASKGIDGYFKKNWIKVKGATNFVLITNLKHDSTYIVKLRACHSANETGQKRCSEYEEKELKTSVKEGADMIPGIPRVTNPQSGNGQNETSSKAYIHWNVPHDPNTMIVSYNVKITKADDDKTFSNCITAKEFENNGFKYLFTLKGTYYVQVQAVPLYAEPSGWTEAVVVRVAADDMTSQLLAILLPVLVLIIAALGGATFFYLRKSAPPPLIPNENYHQLVDIFSRDEYWIEREHVEVGELLGSGAFGEVYNGKYHPANSETIRVAIKMLRETATYHDRKLFLEEATIMKNLRSAHIVELIGAVVNGLPYYILLEMMPGGDLKKYLRDSRPVEINRQAKRLPPSEKELLQFALEIADGMAYLSSRPRSIVHRDLAARNCLLTADNIVKVGDFGRARDVYESEYYRQTFRGMVPVRWMPPESLRDGEYVSKSDVWSYGVVLWEMATLAEEPYQGMQHERVVHYIIEEGGKPEIRQHFPKSLTEIMELCWKRYPDDRPSFLEIVQKLEAHANDRFRRTAFYYTDEAQEVLNGPGEENVEASERPLLRENSSSGYGNGNTGNSNGDARSTSAVDNGHAVMIAASELGSATSHVGEVRQFGHSGGSGVSFRNPSSSSSSSNLSHLRNIWNRIRQGVVGSGSPHESTANA